MASGLITLQIADGTGAERNALFNSSDGSLAGNLSPFQTLSDGIGGVVSPATSGGQATGNASLVTISQALAGTLKTSSTDGAGNTISPATSGGQTTGNATLVTINTALAGTLKTQLMASAALIGSVQIQDALVQSAFNVSTVGVAFDVLCSGYGSIVASFTAIGVGGTFAVYGTDDTVSTSSAVTQLIPLGGNSPSNNGTGPASTPNSPTVNGAFQFSTRGYPRVIGKFTALSSGTYTGTTHLAKDPLDLRSTYVGGGSITLATSTNSVGVVAQGAASSSNPWYVIGSDVPPTSVTVGGGATYAAGVVTFTAVNQSIVFDTAGYGAISLLTGGTFLANLTFASSDSPTGPWLPNYLDSPGNSGSAAPVYVASSTGNQFMGNPGGRYVQISVGSYTSGSPTVSIMLRGQRFPSKTVYIGGQAAIPANAVARTSAPAAVAAGATVADMNTLDGRGVYQPFGTPGMAVRTTSPVSIANTTETTVIATQGSTLRTILDGMSVYNPDSADHTYAIRTTTAGAIAWYFTVAAGTASPVLLPGGALEGSTVNTNITIQIVDTNTIGTASLVTAHGFLTTA